MIFVIFYLIFSCASIGIVTWGAMVLDHRASVAYRALSLKCRACEEELCSAQRITNLGHGARVCYKCSPKIDAELEKILPAWFEAPMPEPKPTQTLKELVRKLEVGGSGDTVYYTQSQLVCPNMEVLHHPEVQRLVNQNPRQCLYCKYPTASGQGVCDHCVLWGPDYHRAPRKPEQMER
jgi:hypothetical protein